MENITLKNEKKESFKRYKVNAELKPFLEKVLERNHISFLIRPGNVLMVEASGRNFHRMVLRARCEQQNVKEELGYNETFYIEKAEDPNKIRRTYPEYEFFKKMK